MTGPEFGVVIKAVRKMDDVNREIKGTKEDLLDLGAWVFRLASELEGGDLGFGSIAKVTDLLTAVAASDYLQYTKSLLAHNTFRIALDLPVLQFGRPESAPEIRH